MPGLFGKKQRTVYGPLNRSRVRANAMNPELNKKILVIDDDPQQLLLLKSVLADKGFQSIGKSSGEQAIRFMQESGPVDIIFSDFKMEGMTGLEFFKIAKKISSDSYRVLVSSDYNIDNLAAHIEEEDIHFFLRKPFLFEDIVEQAERGIMHCSIKRRLQSGM